MGRIIHPCYRWRPLRNLPSDGQSEINSKSQIINKPQIPKFQIPNPKQIQNSKFQTARAQAIAHGREAQQPFDSHSYSLTEVQTHSSSRHARQLSQSRPKPTNRLRRQAVEPSSDVKLPTRVYVQTSVNQSLASRRGELFAGNDQDSGPARRTCCGRGARAPNACCLRWRSIAPHAQTIPSSRFADRRSTESFPGLDRLNLLRAKIRRLAIGGDIL